MKKLQDRIDENKLKKLRDSSFPVPIHAINYVEFSNSRYYRLYGLLLAPYAIYKKARPIWVGLYESNIIGESKDNEIVIVEYPNLNVLIDIFTGKYYEKINWLREKGVKKLGFPICKKKFGNKKINKKELLVVQFNHQNHDKKEVLELFTGIAEKYFKIEYLATEYGFLDIFKQTINTDPVEVFGKNISLLSGEFDHIKKLSLNLKQELERNGFKMVSIQLYRTLGIFESMPWSKNTESVDLN